MEPPDSHRICLTLQYDGGGFFGWQLQPGRRTVQGELERVLGRLLNRPARVLGSGRTDRGVHAAGQVAALDVPGTWSPHALERAMNALLPNDVRVLDTRVVPEGFHPRYSAVARSYVYRLGLSRLAGSPFHARWCWPVGTAVDLDRMTEAAAALVGDHSFEAFAKAGQEERGDRCTVADAHWSPWGALGLEFHVTANRFLHHMVRYLVGTLVDVGSGKRRHEELTELLQRGSRHRTSPPAPPQGLFLSMVRYPKDAWGPLGPPPPVGAEALP